MSNNVINNLKNKFTLNNHSAISTILIFGPIVEIIKNDLSKIIILSIKLIVSYQFGTIN